MARSRKRKPAPKRAPARRGASRRRSSQRTFAAVIAVFLVAALVVAIVIAGWNTSSSNNAPVDGAVIFRQRCSGCHGVTGGGGTGPKLSNGAVVQKYPNIDDEISIVTNGRDGMPAWKNALTKEQIRAVVDYTRTQL